MEDPASLDQAILRAVGSPGSTIEWTYPIGPKEDEPEPEGICFLKGNTDKENIAEVLYAWQHFWPQKGKQQNWDGLARLNPSTDSEEWLLFEAKANHPEFSTPPSGASTKGGREKIEKAMKEVKDYLKVHRFFPWLGTYYQHANRLATLYFLTHHGIPARLVEIFFMGDTFPDSTPCPRSVDDWRSLIRARALTLGIPERHALSDRVHEVFIQIERLE